MHFEDQFIRFVSKRDMHFCCHSVPCHIRQGFLEYPKNGDGQVLIQNTHDVSQRVLVKVNRAGGIGAPFEFSYAQLELE